MSTCKALDQAVEVRLSPVAVDANEGDAVGAGRRSSPWTVRDGFGPRPYRDPVCRRAVQRLRPYASNIVTAIVADTSGRSLRLDKRSA